MRPRPLALCVTLSALLHALAFGAAAFLAARSDAWPALLVQLVGGYQDGAGRVSGPPAQPARGRAQAARVDPAPRAGGAETSRAADAGARPQGQRATMASPPALLEPAEPQAPSQDRLGGASSAALREPALGPPNPPGRDKAAVEGPLTAALPSASDTAADAIASGSVGDPGARRGGSGGAGEAGARGTLGRQGTSLLPTAARDTGGGAGASEIALRARAAPEYEPYLVEFRRRIQGSLRYPLAARRRGLSGTAELELLVGPGGRVERIELVRSSSHALLDEAAMTAVKEATPPPLPTELPSRSLRVRLPVVFELH